MQDNEEIGCMRCKIYQELLEKEINRDNNLYNKELEKYDEDNLVNDANFWRGHLCGLSLAQSLSVVVESKILQHALNELHCKYCNEVHKPGETHEI